MLFLYLYHGDLWKTDLYFRPALFRGKKYLTALSNVADMFLGRWCLLKSLGQSWHVLKSWYTGRGRE